MKLITPSDVIFSLLLLLLVIVGSGEDEKEEPQWTQWFQQHVQNIKHHKKNIEKALVQIKHTLELDVVRQEAWNRQGARIARSCTSDEASAIQVRETSRELSEVKGPDVSVVESEEPFIGMILQVVEVKNGPEEGADAENAFHTHIVPPGDSSRTGTVSSMNAYELLEPIQLDLGAIPKHLFDYAYMPVAGSNQEVGDSGGEVTDNNGHESVDGESSVSIKDDSEVMPLTVSLWWQWWFTIVGSSQRTQGQQNTRYERVGENAFAGGSHGEVWRGRRRCDLSTHNEKDSCDDKKPLILKRLKVEHSVAVMEAGLREVYVGNLLAKDVNAKSLFTVYVDHFFREVPRPSFLGRGPSKEHELWIVFEDAGPSLRSFLYEGVSSGSFILYQQSPLWTALRMNAANITQSGDETCLAVPTQWGTRKDSSARTRQYRSKPSLNESTARTLMRELLKQILSAASYLHKRGIVHRDIKPANVMCIADFGFVADVTQLDPSKVVCRLGDFSSVWDEFTDHNLYSRGPSAKEQTPEYAPPEALPGPSWIPFHVEKPEVYDSWSIGVLALELLLGTPNVFSVDQRTTALLTNKMQRRGASQEEIQRALYLAALSQFCIYMPMSTTEKSWPLGAGDPLFNAAMVKQSCTLKDFHHALRARDPLGIGFDSRDDTFLHLIWKLLAWDPLERITASEALQHPYFTLIDLETKGDQVAGNQKAIESWALDPRMDIRNDDTVTNFTCPKCGRSFDDWRSCQTHATSRKHAKFCTYDRSALPTCLNAHSMLPAHPTSGYCDIQGRRRTIEDFHSIQLHETHQFYGIFDGHTGNLASKYAAAVTYKEVSKRLSHIDQDVKHNTNWRTDVQSSLTDAFVDIHNSFLRAVAASPLGLMDQSGTTATIVYVTADAVIVASLGDSRAVLSSKRRAGNSTVMTAVQLTVDHVAADPAERLLVEERGGVVSISSGLARVNGTLAITRSIGDARLSSLLSREPHVTTMTRQDAKEECGFSILDSLPCFIVLASDGLWDVVTNQEAVDMVAQVVEMYDTSNGISWEEGGAFQEAAELLTQEAYVRGSTDNIGICVIAIN